MSINKKDFISGICDKYDERLLEGRVTIEGNVVADIFSDPLLIDDSTLESKDFITRDGRFLFSLAQDLRKKKISVFDEVSIISNSKESVIDRLNEIGGYETIENMKSVVSTKNWDSYLTTLNKENTILKLASDGFNLFQPIEINDKKVVPLTLFRKMEDSECITDFYESRMASYLNGYSSKVLEEEDMDIDDEFLESCEEGTENGVSFASMGVDDKGHRIDCLPYLSNHILGFIPGTLSMIMGYSSTGKSTLAITILLGLLEDPSQKVLIISNEQKIRAFKKTITILLLCKRFNYYKLTKKRHASGNLNDTDRKMLKKVQAYWREKYYGRMKFIAIPDADTSLVKKKSREYILRYGYNIIFYDTLKLDMTNSENQKEYLSFVKDSREFEMIAKKYNVNFIASAQLAPHTMGKLFLDQTVIGQGKSIKDCCENIIMLRTAYDVELDKKSKYYFRPYRLKKTVNGWVKEDVEMNPDNVYRVVFIDKCRSAANSSDNGQALCYKFMGDFGCWIEYCWCQPKHTQIV